MTPESLKALDDLDDFFDQNRGTGPKKEAIARIRGLLDILRHDLTIHDATLAQKTARIDSYTALLFGDQNPAQYTGQANQVFLWILEELADLRSHIERKASRPSGRGFILDDRSVATPPRYLRPDPPPEENKP